jgi:hypothetical protein
LIVKQHHERWNGNGYPDKLKGRDICHGARILALTDSAIALVSKRPYRGCVLPKETADFVSAFSEDLAQASYLRPQQAMEFIIAYSGELFDPDLVKIFAHVLPTYPTGIMVKLNTGEIGIISNANLQYFSRPKSIKVTRCDSGDIASIPLTEGEADERAGEGAVVGGTLRVELDPFSLKLIQVDAAPPAEPAPPRERFAVFVKERKGPEHEIELGDEVLTIGRAPKNRLCLATDEQVSAYHARIVRKSDGFWIEDLNSSNGTFVNGQQVSETLQDRRVVLYDLGSNGRPLPDQIGLVVQIEVQRTAPKHLAHVHRSLEIRMVEIKH